MLESEEEGHSRREGDIRRWQNNGHLSVRDQLEQARQLDHDARSRLNQIPFALPELRRRIGSIEAEERPHIAVIDPPQRQTRRVARLTIRRVNAHTATRVDPQRRHTDLGHQPDVRLELGCGRIQTIRMRGSDRQTEVGRAAIVHAVLPAQARWSEIGVRLMTEGALRRRFAAERACNRKRQGYHQASHRPHLLLRHSLPKG